MVARLVLIVSLAVACCLLSGWAAAAFFASGSDGFTGSAVVFWWLIFGLVAGIATGIVLSRKLTQPIVFRACLISSAAALALIIFFYVKLNQVTKQPSPQQEQQRQPTAVPARLLQQVEQPMGLGMAKPNLVLGKVLYLYGDVGYEQLPAETKPADSITFIRKDGYTDIRTAPPYLVPEVLKLDYDAFYFRVVSVSRYWVEVIVNTTNNQTAFLDREAVEYYPWPEFFLNVFSVEQLDPAQNPVRARPFTSGSIVSVKHNSFTVVAVHDDWLEVSLNGAGDSKPPYGYIRWRDGNKLLVTYSLLS